MDQYKSPKELNPLKIVWVISIIIFVLYGVFNARSFILGPRIEIIEPTADLITETPLLYIRGIAKNTSFLDLNNRSIYTNKEGYFEDKLLLSKGYNIIQIKGRDRFKNETTKEFRIYYIENSYN